MKRKVIIAGGTGFIGTYLRQRFNDLGFEVILIARQKNCIHWDETQKLIDALDNAEMLINLAGKSVDCRYNKKNKEEILRSRTDTTRILGEAILKCSTPPLLWINSSTATIYRHAEDKPMTEAAGEIGSGFSVSVAKAWEKTFFDFELPHTRQIALRMAIVLGKGGGAMKPMINLVRFGLGGKQGSGSQVFSWLHIEDLYNIILFLHDRNELKGVFNCSAPNPVDNKTVMKTLRAAMHVMFGLPSPRWLLTMGAVLIKTETELVLKSRWVIPERLLNEGYKFRYPLLKEAVENIVSL